MQQALPVALSSQVALQRRLDTLADNLANATTPGHLATNVRFEAALARNGGAGVSFVSHGGEVLDSRRGAMIETGGALDFAVRGEAWLGIETPAGTVLTRDGRTRMDPDGTLRTLEGHAVLDPGGGPVRLDPDGGPVIATADGTLLQGGRQTGRIGLFETDAPPRTRWSNSGVIPSGVPRPVVDRTDVGLVQGHIEGSNVNAVEQMVRLIEVTRGFETVAGLAQRADGTLNEAFRTLAGR